MLASVSLTCSRVHPRILDRGLGVDGVVGGESEHEDLLLLHALHAPKVHGACGEGGSVVHTPLQQPGGVLRPK